MINFSHSELQIGFVGYFNPTLRLAHRGDVAKLRKSNRPVLERYGGIIVHV